MMGIAYKVESASQAAQLVDIAGQVTYADMVWRVRQSDNLGFRALECDDDEVLRVSIPVDGKTWASMVKSVMQIKGDER